jgi:hypothetical protein
MTDPWVVDTNVGIVANNRPEDQPSDRPFFPESVIACTDFLQETVESGSIAVDDSWKIVGEYQHKLNSSGQPGPGDQFLKWVLRNQANPARCRLVDISNVPVPERLNGFRNDEKFFRTALGCPGSTIAQGVDSQWWHRRTDFEAADIKVHFLCPEENKARRDRHNESDLRALH